MSSLYVRNEIKSFITTNFPNERLVDFTSLYNEIKELAEDLGIGPMDNWLGLEFVGDDEIAATIPAGNAQGKYRESGIVYLHIVEPANPGVGDLILARGEALRNLFRGRRIGNILIQSVTPVNTGEGATLKFEAGNMSGSVILSYECELNLG